MARGRILVYELDSRVQDSTIDSQTIEPEGIWGGTSRNTGLIISKHRAERELDFNPENSACRKSTEVLPIVSAVK